MNININREENKYQSSFVAGQSGTESSIMFDHAHSTVMTKICQPAL